MTTIPRPAHHPDPEPEGSGKQHVPAAWRTAADALARAGCRTVFGLPSDEPGLLDAALHHPALEVRVIGDQRVAACAAAGHALVAGKPAVLALDSGPSFANAVVGLVEASSLGAPVVVVTSRIGAELVGRGGFQHLDQRAMVATIAEWTVLVDTPGRLVWALREAVSRSLSGRSGVTVVEITAEVAGAAGGGAAVGPYPSAPVELRRSVADGRDVRRAAGALAAAERPVIVVGGGWRWSADPLEVAQLAELLSAPVFTTAAGRGAIDECDPRSFGLVGLYASHPAERLLDAADAVLLLASRFEETARMGWDSWRTATVVQVDRSSDALGESTEGVLGLLGDVGPTSAALAGELRSATQPCRRSWIHLQREVRAARRDDDPADRERSPVRAGMRAALDAVGPVATIVQENGLHDIWSYDVSVVTVRPGTSVVCPGEQTMMGFGMGAAVGAAVANGPGAVTLLFTGDSAFRLGVGALHAMREHSSGVVVVVFDDGGFGWPRHLRTDDGPRDALTRTGSPLLAADVARAFGGWGADVGPTAELHDAMRHAGERARTGCFAVVRIGVPDDDVPDGIVRVTGNGPAHPIAPTEGAQR